MGRLIRAHDWAATSLGPRNAWPQRLQGAVDLLIDSRQPVFLAWGPELTFFYNDACIPMLGTRHPGSLGKSYPKVFPEIWDQYGPIVERTLAGESQYFANQCVALAERPDQPMSWFALSWSPLRAESGHICGFFCAATETTAHVLAEGRLRESESSYRSLFDSMSEGFCIIEKVATPPGEPIDFRYVAANPAFEAESGVGGVVGKTIRTAFPGEPQGWFDTYDSVVSSGQPVRFERELVTQGRHLEVYAFKVEDDTGRRVAVIFQDITARKRIEAALRETEGRFRQFGEASSDVLWIRDAATLRWEYLTPSFETIYGIDGELVCEGGDVTIWMESILAEDRERTLEGLQRVRNGESVTVELRIKRQSDGQIRWLRNTDFPIRDETGKVYRIGGISSDITEEKATADRLGVLVAELQHRTRNLMALVRAVADKTLASSENLEQFAPRYRDRLASLARAQNLLSRLDEHHRVTVDEIVHAELSAHGAFNENARQVTIYGPRGIAIRPASVQPLAMVLHELATNAVKYGALCQPLAHLTVGWRLEGQGDGDERASAPLLVIEWREYGVEMPSRDTLPRGGSVGRELIEQVLPYQLKARIRFVLGRDGVHCVMELPSGVQA
jgi:PAS domain S-box-containing protein